MTHYLAALTVILLFGMVVTRVVMMKRRGIKTVHFGKLDKTDFLIPPFALFLFYQVFAAAFNFPAVSTQEFFNSEFVSWIGVFLGFAGLMLLLWSLISFGQSFRIGIDTEQPENLITTGAFAFTRNPIYLAFAFILLGQFLVFSNWIILIYLAAAIWLFHRQILREEDYLKSHYGDEFLEYCKRVRRYI